MIAKLLLIGLGGCIGAIARFGANAWALGTFPRLGIVAGTLLVNLSGCLAIGVLFRLAEALPALDSNFRAFVFVGLLGSFTTFSTFSLELMQLARAGGFAPALLYVAASVVGGLALTWVGYGLTASLLRT
ncbi:fluoride efflux transporter CrcB [soil metagenome]